MIRLSGLTDPSTRGAQPILFTRYEAERAPRLATRRVRLSTKPASARTPRARLDQRTAASLATACRALAMLAFARDTAASLQRAEPEGRAGTTLTIFDSERAAHHRLGALRVWCRGAKTRLMTGLMELTIGA